MKLVNIYIEITLWWARLAVGQCYYYELWIKKISISQYIDNNLFLKLQSLATLPIAPSPAQQPSSGHHSDHIIYHSPVIAVVRLAWNTFLQFVVFLFRLGHCWLDGGVTWGMKARRLLLLLLLLLRVWCCCGGGWWSVAWQVCWSWGSGRKVDSHCRYINRQTDTHDGARI